MKKRIHIPLLQLQIETILTHLVAIQGHWDFLHPI